MWWNDTSLAWDPSKYGNVKQIMVPTDSNAETYGWIPDIFIREDAGATLLSNIKYTNMELKYTGALFNEAFGEILVSFNPEVEMYPYDLQNISMTLGSNSYTDDVMEVDLYPEAFLV
jgi:hypothetical protein